MCTKAVASLQWQPARKPPSHAQFIGSLRGVGGRGVGDYTSLNMPYYVLSMGMKAPYPPPPYTPLRVLMINDKTHAGLDISRCLSRRGCIEGYKAEAAGSAAVLLLNPAPD